MWHVLHTAPHCEQAVAKFLTVHSIESYTPEFPTPARTKPGSVRDRRHRWVFPCYVFFKTPEAFALWDTIRWAPGVRRLLHQDGKPGLIAESVIEQLRGRLAERSLTPVRERFQVGQAVVIERGPLGMVDAIFERHLSGAARVQILIHLLGRPLSVTIDPAILRPAG
jgi:transcription antitermination factor NusG